MRWEAGKIWLCLLFVCECEKKNQKEYWLSESKTVSSEWNGRLRGVCGVISVFSIRPWSSTRWAVEYCTLQVQTAVLSWSLWYTLVLGQGFTAVQLIPELSSQQRGALLHPGVCVVAPQWQFKGAGAGFSARCRWSPGALLAHRNPW